MRWTTLIHAARTTLQLAFGFALLIVAEPGTELILNGWKWT
jgi:hypothetical protein